MKIKGKKGISLIVLTITIVVMITIAAAVILTLNSGKTIEKANTAKLQSDLKTIQEEIIMYEKNQEISAELSGKDSSEISVSGDEMVKLFPSTKGYKDKIKIKNSKILLDEKIFSMEEMEIAKEMGFGVYNSNYTEEFTKKSTYEKIKTILEKRTNNCQFDDATKTITVALDTDIKIKKAASSEYGDTYVSETFTSSKAASLTADVKATIDLDPVRKILEAYMELERLDLFYPGQKIISYTDFLELRGQFVLDVLHDSRIEVDNKDAHFVTNNMVGFNSEAKQILLDTRRTYHVDSIKEGYSEFWVYTELYSPDKGISKISYSDLKEKYDTVLKDITIDPITITASVTDAEAVESKYYTVSMNISGEILVICPDAYVTAHVFDPSNPDICDDDGVLFTIKFTSKQKDGAANNYTGIQSWETISATMALIKNRTGGGGGGGGSN